MALLDIRDNILLAQRWSADLSRIVLETVRRSLPELLEVVERELNA